MAGTGYGHGGPIQAILDVLPTDSTFHVTDCGYDDNDGRCGCYDLPSKLRKVVDEAQRAAVQALIDTLAHEDWCCAKGCICRSTADFGCPGCTCLVSTFQRAADAVYRPGQTQGVNPT